MPSIAKVYKPVVRATQGPFSAAALVGSHTVILGWDVDPAFDRSNLLGFAVRRSVFDPDSEGLVELNWLRGQKRFKAVSDDLGVEITSDKAPFQRFRWSDYTVKPDASYLYEIYPVTGAPGALVRGDPIALAIRPAPYNQDGLGVYSNRGVTAAFAYLQRFENARPAEVPDGAAYRWLSRGLKESLLDFIGRAHPGDGLHVAIYEFHDHDVATALKTALDQGVGVQILYHAVDPASKTVIESVKTLEEAGLTAESITRSKIKISHNKFVVLLKGGKPQSVWSGSSNFTEAGFYLQTNMGLVVEHEQTAQAFEDYFQVLTKDPAKARKKKGQTAAQDMVENVISASQAAMNGNPFSLYFSPVRRDHIVEAAVELVQNAKSAVLMSTPFGMDKRIIEALGANDDKILEYGLANTTARKKIEALNRRNTRFFTPTRLETYMGRSWDAKAFGSHKIHAKLLVVDPWSDSPSVLIGSANFSDESCTKNDENALLARGNKRLAAMVAVEFLRMFDHYKSRWFINQFYSDTVSEDRYLADDGSWSDISFNPNSPSHKFRDREVFAGKI